MYNKLFTKILDSSIWLAPDPHRLVWITFLAAMDEDGNAMFACADNVAARARVTVQQAEKAIEAFESPDLKSGDPEFDGRRIERIPGGWYVLNADKYRKIVTKSVQRELTKQRVANFRARQKSVTQSNASNKTLRKSNRSVTQSDADADAESDADAEKNPSARKSAPSEFVELKTAYPKRAGDQGWTRALRACNARLAEGHTWKDMLEGALRYYVYCKSTDKIGTEFVKQASTFFGPEKHFLADWDLPKTKADSARDSNVDATQEWLSRQEIPA